MPNSTPPHSKDTSIIVDLLKVREKYQLSDVEFLNEICVLVNLIKDIKNKLKIK